MQSTLCTLLKNLKISPVIRSCSTITAHSTVARQLCNPNLQYVNIQQNRRSSFFLKNSAEELWKSITVVSNAGQRRGRGRKSNRKLITDLNIGRRLGDGKLRMSWPGLNTRLFQGKNLVDRENAPQAKILTEEELIERRKARKGVRSRAVHPLIRGFTSKSLAGRSVASLGSASDLHPDFNYFVLDVDNVCHMNRIHGRVQRAAVIVACGNGNGIIGFSRAKSKRMVSAAQIGARQAINKLLHVERYKDHTVLHDFFSQFYRTKLFVTKKPEGYGLRCHRVIGILCKLIGIKDIHVKVEGSVNVVNIVKAFILGLVRQRSYQDMADEKQLHLVEFDPQRRGVPVVLASPDKCRTKGEIPSSESLDFRQLALGGRVMYAKPKRPPFYTKLPGWQRHLTKAEPFRGRTEQKLELLAQYGEIRSFLTDKFPECRPQKPVKPE